MENRISYYNWFKKVMSVFIDVFFFAVPFASLYVFTSTLSGAIRIISFIALIAVYFLVIHFFKDKIKLFIEDLLDKVDKLDEKKMLIIIALCMIVIKVIFTIFFNYDATKGGDVEIYNEIAEHIYQTGDIHSDAISHLYGIALHFVLFKMLGLPLFIGMFIVFFVGTIINFFSFKEIIGKNKTFLIIMFYIFMPSSALLTFCPTHEVFVYMYISLFLFAFNRFLKSEDIKKTVLYTLLMIVATVLTCFVNPGGYIIYIIMALAVALSNTKINKKALIIVALIISVLCSNGISKFLNVNEYNTTINTYTILIHGTNPEALGEQVDGYPLKQMRMYIYDHGSDFSQDGFREAAKNVFINQVVYLFTHPVNLIRLVVHKFYILWSGVHYPIELARFYNAMDGFVYYALLGISTLMYLFIFTVANVYYKKKEDDMMISNYKLELLGVIALTMVCIVVNKYSLYVTLFAFMIAMYRVEFKNE